MSTAELRAMSLSELEQQAQQERERLFRLRMLLYTNQLEKPSAIRDTRRQIARIETLLSEKRAN